MNRKIALIINRTSENLAAAFEESMKMLSIPEDYQVEIIELRGEANVAKSYNEAMKQSDARIKIYLDEGTLFVDALTLQKMVDIFDSNKDLGLLGVSGVEQLPADGRQYKAKRRTGKLLSGPEAVETTWQNAAEVSLTKVMAADRYLLATQYDVDWREDLFGGRSFFEAAASLEFIRKGYTVGVAAQDSPWVWNVAGEEEFPDENERQIFLAEYSKDCFPLVSVIIPTYNRPAYFEEALKSAVDQTYRNLDIFVTDNSTDSRTEEIIRKYLERDSRITYVRNKATDADGNWLCARRYNNPAAEYAKYLMDDDILYPTQIERMMQAFFDNPTVSLVTSYRKRIDSKGGYLPDKNFNKPFVNEDTLIPGEAMGRMILANNKNMIGEPTTVLMKKKYLRNNDLGWTGNEGKYLHYLMPDYQTFLQLLSQGDLYYIAEPLSCFREHESQGQNDFAVAVSSEIGWAMEIEHAWQNKIYLRTEKDYRYARWQAGYRKRALSCRKLSSGRLFPTTAKSCTIICKRLQKQ